jgi:predicted dehydrogenase
MSKLKLGVIGTGGIFRGAHLPGWLSCGEIEIAGFYDANLSSAESLTQDYPGSQLFNSYQDMLNDRSIDLIDICTPNVYHSEIAVAALKAGKHVFCEKPDAINPVEAQRMADAAKASGKLLMTMRNNRFTPQAKFLKPYIDQGHQGSFYSGRCGWLRRRGIPGQGGWFTTKAMSGGGPLIDLGVHMIDLALWFMGNPKPVSVSGAAYQKFAGQSEQGVFDVEDLASGFIRFDNGASLQIEFSWASNIDNDVKFVELRGTQGGFSLVNDELKLYTEINHVLCDIIPKFNVSASDQHINNIIHFVDCIQGRSMPTITPEEGVDMIKILSAIYKSAETGQEILV